MDAAVKVTDTGIQVKVDFKWTDRCAVVAKSQGKLF